MIKLNAKGVAALCAALLMAAALPLGALAQDAGQSAVFVGGGMPFVDASALSADQQAAYDKAKADYEAIEDQQLGNLVTAGTISQADADAYIQQRTEGGQPQGGGQRQQITMTDEQRDALMQAMQSDNREQAIADLVAQGVLTQDQADMMSQLGGQGQGAGGLWARVRQVAETDTAASIALNNIQVAGQMMRQALSDAGIEMPQMGQLPDGAQPAP